MTIDKDMLNKNCLFADEMKIPKIDNEMNSAKKNSLVTDTKSTPPNHQPVRWESKKLYTACNRAAEGQAGGQEVCKG